MTMTTWEFIRAIGPEGAWDDLLPWNGSIDVAWTQRDPQADVDWAYHTRGCATD